MGIIKNLYSQEQNTVAKSFALLSHPGRLKIVQLLLINESLSLGEIQEQVGLSQAAMSEQVRKLRDAELIRGYQVETSMRYHANKELLRQMKEKSENFWIEVETYW